MKPETLDFISQTTQELLKKIGLSHFEVSLTPDQENNVVNLNLQSPDAALLIGYHGQTLFSLQLILGLMVYNKTGSWTRLVLEVGDYRAQRTRQLQEMADRIAEKVKFSRQASTLNNLNSSERRIIHLHLAADPEIETESVGSGTNRQLIIRPASPKP